MKIIRPMGLSGGEIGSSAPADEYAQWAPVGRDFLSAEDSSASDSLGGAAFFATAPGVVRKVDLSTGSVSTINLPGHPCFFLTISPDGSYLCAALSISSGTRIAVIRISDGLQVYSYDSAIANLTPKWSYNASHLFAAGKTSGGVSFVFYIAVASWASAGSFNPPADYDFELSQTNDYAFIAVRTTIEPESLCASTDDDSCYVIANFAGKDRDDVFGPLYHMRGLFKFSITNGAAPVELVKIYGISTEDQRSYRRIVHNSTRSEILMFSPGAPQARSELTLALQGLAPASLAASDVQVSPEASEIIVKQASTQPYWRRFAASNYTALTALDSALPSPAKKITYSDDYYVATLQSGGYALIDRTDDTLITQTNPTITKGDIYTYGSRNYEALENNNDRPDLGAQLELPTWLDLGYINPLRMFDGKLDSVTTAPSPLTITVTPGMITNGLALFNVLAATVQVTMDDPTDGQVYDSGEIQMLDNSAVNNWWDFFFAPYLEKADLALIDLPPYPDATLTITLSSDGGDVALGEMVLGRVQNIGETQYGTSVGIIDASTKERDIFGNFEIIERKFSKRAEFDVSVPTSSASGMQRILAQYRAAPVVWVGNMGLEATIVYGFYRDFQINFSHYSLSDATITVEGL